MQSNNLIATPDLGCVDLAEVLSLRHQATRKDHTDDRVQDPGPEARG
nr:MAG TPA: hypothetical protein [Caudoviricetes sp.]